jgi:hypothetical protein
MPDVQTLTYSSGFPQGGVIIDEVDDMITNMSPKDRPFLASIGKGTCSTTTPDWLEDVLATAAENKVVEGADAVAVALDPPDRLTNYTQIMEKTFLLSNTLQASQQHGYSDPLSYYTGKAMDELGNDMEWNFLNNAAAAGNSSTAREMDGALAWAHANSTYTFGGTAASTNHITEDILLDVMQAMYELGATPDTILAPPAQKRKISNFTADGRLVMNMEASKKEVVMSVRLIDTDFGIVAVIPERFIAATGSDPYYDSMLIYEKKHFTKLILKGRGPKREELAKTGDARKFQIVTEQTLKCASKKAVGKITNLSRVKVS